MIMIIYDNDNNDNNDDDNLGNLGKNRITGKTRYTGNIAIR